MLVNGLAAKLICTASELGDEDGAMAGTILVVDDEPTIREMVGFALSRAGFSYIEASDVSQAEAEIAREIPDLIVLDWMLPGQPGIEFVKHLRSDEATRAIPVIMLTARGEEADKVRGLKGGADDFIIDEEVDAGFAGFFAAADEEVEVFALNFEGG